MNQRLWWSTLLCALMTSQPLGRAADISFKLRDFAEKPVAGRIEMSVPQKGQEVSYSWRIVLLLDKGDGRYQAKCDTPGILFRAAPFDLSYYLERAEMFKPCTIGEILFHFRRKDYASILTQALSNDTHVLATGSESVRTLHSITVQALQSGNYPIAAANSMLLRDEVEKQFGTKAAEPYRVLSEDLAASPIAAGQPLIFDPPQKKYVLAPSAVQEIAKFQRNNGIAGTGILTWSTALRLPDMSQIQLGAREDDISR